MSRPLLDPSATDPQVQEAQARYHRTTVDEVIAAVARDRLVVVGMGWNPFVRKTRATLSKAHVPFTYLGYGNYLSAWKPRLAIKLWSGWPTFPQVFLDGTLIGGNQELQAALADGSLQKRLAQPKAS